MSSLTHGTNTSDVEVTHISGNGIWLLTNGQEHFLPFQEFPWFQDASVGQIQNVTQPSVGHFYWPDLDIDLSEKSIQDPNRYPLRAR